MISIILLLKIIGGICFIAAWVFIYLCLRRTEGRLECLKEHCDERLTAMARAIEAFGEDDEPENGDLAESRRRALEAERRFTEGIASILNFSASHTGNTAAGDLNANDFTTGKKGE